eukprot:5435448-Pleurochrysis_carterae.AAC.1
MCDDRSRARLKATIRGGQGEASRSTTRQAIVREEAQARGLSAPTRRLWVGVLSGRRRPCASQGSRAWGAERERCA